MSSRDVSKDDAGASSPLDMLRAGMEQRGLDGYIIYSTDPHQSEYSLPHWNVRRWISGFTGSAGVVVLTRDRAGLWTDSRYAIQAREQLQGSGIELFLTGLPDSKSPSDFLRQALGSGSRVGADGSVLACKPASDLRKKLAEAGIEFDPGYDLVADLWKDRPPLSDAVFESHPIEFAGKTRIEKLAELRAAMKEKKLGAWLVSALDSVAWLFNIRGGDGICSPLARAYGLVLEDRCLLFASDGKVPAELRRELEGDGVEIHGYGEIGKCLADLPSGTTVGIAPASTAHAIKHAVSSRCAVKEHDDLVGELKCIKNSVEQENLRRFQIRDSVAVLKFLAWFDSQLGDEQMSEISTAERLRDLRLEQGALGVSFETIAGYGPHGALPHYMATPESNLKIRPEGFALFDSGGQYRGATTDITRTVACGPLSERMRRDYTLVLTGLVDLSRQPFAEGAKGSNLDLLARSALWREGLDFKHGTGHGVGSYLNVHEGPCGISLRSEHPLKPGMVLTVEPGLYREGEYGIRIENMVLIEEERETEFGKFMRFSTVTLVPFERRAIDVGMLAPEQIEWIDRYHRRVREALSPELAADEREYLERMTAPLHQ